MGLSSRRLLGTGLETLMGKGHASEALPLFLPRVQPFLSLLTWSLEARLRIGLKRFFPGRRVSSSSVAVLLLGFWVEWKRKLHFLRSQCLFVPELPEVGSWLLCGSIFRRSLFFAVVAVTAASSLLSGSAEYLGRVPSSLSEKQPATLTGKSECWGTLQLARALRESSPSRRELQSLSFCFGSHFSRRVLLTLGQGTIPTLEGQFREHGRLIKSMKKPWGRDVWGRAD